MKKSKLLLGLTLVLGPFLWGQKKTPSAVPPAKTTPIASTKYDPALFEGVKWRLVGPFRGGRAGTVTGVPGQPNLYYVGTSGGGVWRTQDGGQTWHCISDGFFGGSIGAVAVSESDPNVIYVGEGEQTVRGNVSSGWGLWRSTDAGKTWKSIGLRGSEHIGRIRIHPQNPDVVYVAAMGNLWKPNDMRGVYRSKDGGKNWERVLFESEKAGAVDLTLDPRNPRIIYASTWEISRNGYRMDSGGPGSHLWKSTDGGDTWIKLTAKPGMPKGPIGIICIAVSPLNSNRIYTMVEAEEGGVFSSDDGGETWKKQSEDRELRQRAWYYSRIYADTKDEDKIYIMNVDAWRSKDGGKTYEKIETPHGDHHDLWIAPEDANRMIIADDGGAQISTDGAENWTTYHNQPTAQFYRVSTDNHFPFRILGAQQDNSTVRIAHRSVNNAITDQDWDVSAGGESAHLVADPENPEIVYGGNYKGYMSRFDHSVGQERSTNIWPDNPAGSGVEVMKYRFNWNFPILFSPNNPKKLYAGSNYLHVSYNEGQSWKVISPDLTRGEPKTLKSSGGPITQDNTGVEYYANIFAIAESKLDEKVIWCGSDDGLVHVTRDGGATWQNVTPLTSPKRNMINSIEASPFDAGTAYIAATHYKFGDYTPYLYKTSDYGKTWQTITTGIDPNHYTRVIREDPARKGLLYAGTEWGIYFSLDDGVNWQSLQLNLPITSIADLTVRDNSLIAATHGRSFWMIDDLTPFQQLGADVAGRNFYLYPSKPAYRLQQEPAANAKTLRTAGENHPNGVIFHYFIKDLDDSTKVQLDVLDAKGALIRSFNNRSKDRKTQLTVKKGGNRMVWDLRYPGFKDFPGMVLYSAPNVGPKAVPGNYKARLTVNGQSVEQTFTILKDPRLKNTPADYQKQFDFLIKVRDRVSEAHQAINNIRALKRDWNGFKEKMGKDPAYETLVKQGNEFETQLTAIENSIHQTKNKSQQDPINYGIKVNNRLAFLLADQQLGDFPPTDQAEEVYQALSAELETALSKLRTLLKEGIPKLNQLAQEKGVPLLMEKK